MFCCRGVYGRNLNIDFSVANLDFRRLKVNFTVSDAYLLYRYVHHLFGLEKLFLEKLFQVPHRGFVFYGHRFFLQLAAFQADESVGQCVLLLGRNVLSDDFQ